MRTVTVSIPVILTIAVNDGESVARVMRDLEFDVKRGELDTYDVQDLDWTPNQSTVLDSR